MNGKKAIRVVLDTALTLMLVFEMFIQFTGEFLHEVVGFAFFATVVLHLALSAAWVKKTARNAKEGKMTARRTALAVVGSLLAVTMIILGVSSVAISGILSSAGFVWPIGTYAMWATVHAFSSYALCALVVVHLAVHWVFLASAFKVPYNPSRRRAIATGVNTVAALGVLALGSTAVGKIAPQVASAASTDQATAGAAGESAAVETANASGASAGSESFGNVSDAPAPTADTSAPSTDAPAPSGKSGKSHGKGSSSSASASSSGAPSGSSSTVPSAGSASASAPANEGSGSGTAGNGTSASSASPSSGPSSASNTSSSSASGICTLCRKQCSLSAPKCDKPYAAGLL